MKLKCIDGKVRNFVITTYDKVHDRYAAAYCEECGYDFGVHDTAVLKPEFKAHVCKPLK